MKTIFKTFFEKIISRLRFVKSLRFRIFLIIIVVGYVPTLIMRYGILQNYESRAVSLRTAEVENQAKILANHLAVNNYLQNTNSDTINAELLQLSTLYDGRVLVIDQNFVAVKDTYGISEGKTIISEEVIKCFKGKSISNYDSNNHYIEITTPITLTAEVSDEVSVGKIAETENQTIGVMLISVSTDNINIQVLDEKAQTLQLLMTLLVIGLSWVASRVLMKPFDKVTSAIGEVRDGFEGVISDVPDYEETEHIIVAFNEVLKRMKILDESRQEFVSNVSHELKTPLTSMKVLADSLNSQDNVPIELYQEFMLDIADEIDRESKIINDLLSLVKMDKTSADLNVEAVDINKMIESILKRLKPIADQKDIDLIFESVRDVTAEIDEVKLTLAISNLVENGIKYNREHGYVKVRLDADHQFFVIQVEDNGIGIPEESIEHIFERFYRVDKARSREQGGTGLGLAIAKEIIENHGGTITMESKFGEYTKVTIKLPPNGGKEENG